MYVCNFRQISNCETWLEQFSLVASDDNTPIQNDQAVVKFQVWNRSARGSGDQSQYLGYWPITYGGYVGGVPAISAASNDGSGVVTLYDGVITINVPSTMLQRLIPGYYEVGLLISEPDLSSTAQLAVGMVPIYNGGVWNWN